MVSRSKTVDELRKKFSVPGVTFDDNPAEPSPKVVMCYGKSVTEIFLFGAHVFRWKIDGK